MSELSEREIERLTTELRAAAAIAKRLSEAEDEIEQLRTAGAQAIESKRLEAAPISADELNFIKNFWRAEPSCMELNCNADCNPLTAHCGRDDEVAAAFNIQKQR